MPTRSYQPIYDRLPIALQQLVVRTNGWYSYRMRSGPHFEKTLAELEQTDLGDADHVREDQDQRLRSMIDWAARTVPFYKELFRKEGIDPSSIRTVDDLKAIPPLDKETVRARQNEFVSEGISRGSLIPAFTSGTTGTALTILRTRESMSAEYAVAWRQRRWFGIQPGERFAAFGGQTVVPLQQKSPPFWRKDPSRSRVLFSLYHMSEKFLEHYATELMRSGYVFWQGYPSSIGLLSEYMLDRGLHLGEAAPRAVFTSSESLLDFHRERIKEVTRAPISDRYGNTESSVSVAQCPEGSYHVDTEACAVEIEAHEETDDWVRGEVISTGFGNTAMPFIRYRTGDVATLLKRSGCPCGRSRPILDRIDGRVEDYVVTPEGRRIGRMDHIFKDAHEVREAQIYQASPGRILVRLVPRPEFGLAAQRRLDREFRVRLGDEIRIDYDLIDSIPRAPNGKFRVVISELDAGKLQGADSLLGDFAARSEPGARRLPAPRGIEPDLGDRDFREEVLALEPRPVGPGRMLHAQADGTLYMCRQYDIFRSDDDAQTWRRALTLPRTFERRIADVSRLACRLLRNEVRALEVLSSGNLVGSNRQAVFWAAAADEEMRVSKVERGSELAKPPMHFCVGPNDAVLWGEYFANPGRREVRLFGSDDNGEHYGIGHVFPAGAIRHIHNIIYDPGLDHYWVLAGDHDEEPGIGCLSSDLRHFEWLVKGSQKYRAVCAFDFGDSLIYGMDTEVEPNWIIRLDKASGRTERVVPVEGSCVYACRFGGIYALSTTVEPSEVNASQTSVLWLSRDGEHWERGYEARKDGWSAKYLQYGTLVLPSGASEREVVAFSGQAVREIEGLSMVARVEAT